MHVSDFFNFVSESMTGLFNADHGLAAFVGIGLIVLTTLFLGKKGLAGLGFWGKQRKKIAQYEFNEGRWNRRVLIYKLRNRKGYEGYGIEFSNTKHRSTLGSAGMSVRVSAIEFTKYEADKMVELISPYLGNGASR